MKTVCRFSTWVLLLCLTSISSSSFGTHLKGGEIRVNRSSEISLSYTISLIIYSDDNSPVPAANGVINFGDGSGDHQLLDLESSSTKEELGGSLTKTIFTTSHTFPSTGTFVISFKEFNRTPHMTNMEGSVNTPFYIESQIVIDSYLGPNTSPELTENPLFYATVGSLYLSPSGAIDAEGDSLAYKVLPALQDKEQPIQDYRFPNELKDENGAAATSEGDAVPVYTFDSETGTLIWDAPVVAGHYVITYMVEEWRKIDQEWVQLGYTLRDYVIHVDDAENRRPFLNSPSEITVRGGSLLSIDIPIGDPDGDALVLETSGLPYELETQAATASLEGNVVRFRWQTEESLIRNEPYKVTFKISDTPASGPALHDYKEMKIRIAPITHTDHERNRLVIPVEVYPNPSRGIFTLRNLSTSHVPAKIYIYNPVGQLIFSKELQSFEEHIIFDLSPFGRGMYFISYDTPKRKFTKRLMVID